ncbi:MAG: IclR family transcriptional regulator [Bacilli bacterium]|nr:IclR family transcriptional regulator [Bacilli bacterium]
MQQRYRVPALEKASQILSLLAAEPARMRLMDLSTSLVIHKSSMFSLLHTLENLGWVVKEKDSTYSLGPSLGVLSASYFRQFNLLQAFHQEAKDTVRTLNEAVQLAMLDGQDIVYLAKEEYVSPIRLVSDPGMRFPAYATALGKSILAQYDLPFLKQLYPEEILAPMTASTVADVDELWQYLQEVRQQGYAFEQQEAVAGFCCVAAPVLDYGNRTLAAVSVSMMETSWNVKFEQARQAVIDLARRLSRQAGYVDR